MKVIIFLCHLRDMLRGSTNPPRDVPPLPVPIIIGRDCPSFHRLWNPKPEYRPPRNTSQRQGRVGLPAYGARVPLSTPSESSAEEDGSDGDDPILPSTPAHSTGGTLGQDLGNQTTTLRRRRQLRNRQARQEKQRAHPSPSSRISTRQGDGERIGPGSSQMLNFRTTP